ncbi:hypothetical protein QT971_18430 [Microcoleus sp. herbarium19]
MLYIAQKSCAFFRQMELPATQEKTANPGKSPMNPGEWNSRLHKLSS